MISKALNEGSSLDRSFVLANMLRTSTLDIQDEMLSILAEKDPAALHDPTMKFTGVQGVVDRFIKTDGELVKAAGVAMEKADNAKSHQVSPSKLKFLSPAQKHRIKISSP